MEGKKGEEHSELSLDVDLIKKTGSVAVLTSLFRSMSRVSPYSATPRNARPIADYGEIQSTRPLEIGRPLRPSTPTDSASSGPSRPQRSGLRTRQTSISSVDPRTTTRESKPKHMLETRQTPPHSRSRPTPMQLPPASPDEISPLSTTSPINSTTMNAALSALNSAGQRRRAMTAGSEDAEWERQRTLDQEAERQLQKRIKDRVPQKRAKGKAKAGDIDGMSIASVVVTCGVVFTVHLRRSGAGSNSRRMGTLYITRCETRRFKRATNVATLK